MAVFAKLTRWFNQDTYIIFWGDVLEIGICHLRWLVARGGVWPHLLEAKTSRYWTWKWHRSCRLERLGGWSWLKTDFSSWKMDLFEAEKRSYWRVPPTHFPLFPMIVGGFVYWLANLGTPQKLWGFGLAFLGHHASGPWCFFTYLDEKIRCKELKCP